ncbi:ATP-binding protein [Hydrogenophaga sp.]|uniref:ATP-binding protein n=1 Tax=Hydrogenophaga sp. TaxID=1904254 RepID=UPI0027268547|nr:ATP-binding protein [Hydrogenophaga sp.]MDO9434886.1 ATP-binding protein [Hydrogenophaga sp.]
MNTTTSTWSIAQRLGAGFAVLLLVLSSFVGLIAWQLAQNDEASKALDAAIADTRRIDAFDNAVLQLAVSTRDVLRERTPQNLDAFAEAERRLDTATRALTGDSRALAPFTVQYARASRDAVNSGEVGPLPLDLSVLRQALMARSHAIVEQQNTVSTAAIERMRANRSAAVLVLFVGASLTVLVSLLIAYITTRSVSAPARQLVGVAAALRSGNWRPALNLAKDDADRGTPTANEMAQIGRAFGTAALALELREQRLEAHTAIAKASGASLDSSQIADAVLRILLQQVQAEVGVLFAKDADSGMLAPVAERCVTGGLMPVAMGEGLVGQCAQDRALVIWRDLPPDSPFSVGLGSGHSPARSVAAIPLAFGDKLLGVLVVASLREFQDAAITFLQAAASQIAVGLMNAQVHEEVQQLLVRLQLQSEQVQAQNEELQAQNEEIQAQHEELQAQTEEIQAQNEELQAQTEEIQAQNDDLQRQTLLLREQTGALQEADAHKNEFLGLLAHELRNPLTPISNCVELLTRRNVEPQAVKKIEDILGRQVRHLTHLIDDLLDVTRVNRGKVSLKRQRLNLTELVNQCIHDQQVALEQAGLELAVALPDVPIHVDGDHTRICQVFSNLLGNAIKFCQPGCTVGVTVTLDPPRRLVSIHVTDTGEGIDPALLSRIFEPFYQADNDLARTRGGLGLGLALAKGLVEMHGGSIDVHSEGKGRGAEFVVSLPLAETADHPSSTPDGDTALATARQSLSTRVLVVDDNADAADSMADLLRLEGCRVEVAYTAHNGLDVATRTHPDVILCDIGLPVMDGYAFAREVRQHPQLRPTLLIALTGYTLPADQQRAAEAGFDMHLAKPPDYERIVEIVRSPAAARKHHGPGTPGDAG